MKNFVPRSLNTPVVTTLTTRLMIVSIVLAATGLAACNSSSKGTGSKDTASMGVVNARCPMKPDCGKAPSAASSVSFKGEKVGFCCPGCIGEWNELSDQQKGERLAKVR